MKQARQDRGIKTKSLTDLYETFNQNLFRGRLPRYRVRRACFDAPGQYGLCRQEKQTILIRPGLDGNDLRETLLHEMCHIGSTGHGKRFQAKLARLESLGEKWAEKQRASYEEACRSASPITANIRHTIDDWVWQCADIPWTQIRKLLAREVGLSPNRLIKAAPWVRRVWQREVAEWRFSEHKREMLRAKLSRETTLPRNS